jgi:hypothetical protein
MMIIMWWLFDLISLLGYIRTYYLIDVILLPHEIQQYIRYNILHYVKVDTVRKTQVY